MGSGRKAGKKAALEGGFLEPQDGQVIMRVVALRGCNLVEVENGSLEKTLCIMPAKFSKCLWIKRGNFVLVDEGDRQKVLDSNGKVSGTIAQVLYRDQVRALQKTEFWPAGFEVEGRKEIDDLRVGDGDDDLPVNTNRCYLQYSSSGEESE